MEILPFIDTPAGLQEELKTLALLRKTGNLKAPRKYRLSKSERQIIYLKTYGKCHICGIEHTVDKFEADHVKFPFKW